MSQNYPRLSNSALRPISRRVVERKQPYQGLEGPALAITMIPELKSVFALQPPQKVFPSSPNNNVNAKLFRPVTAPANIGDSNSQSGTRPQAPFLAARQEVEMTLPQKVKPPTPIATNTGTVNQNVNVEPHSTCALDVRCTTPECQSQSRPESALTSCLKAKGAKAKAVKASGSTRLTRAKTPNVTFAPDTVIFQRENKPKKPRNPKKNRKPRFAHPCCGHFLPPEVERVTIVGPIDLTDQNNTYVRFTSAWVHPFKRTSKESIGKLRIRQKRFEKLLTDISEIYRSCTFPDQLKNQCMTKEILPRYIMALDIALMDADLAQAERLVNTILTTIRLLQATLHDEFFFPNGQIKPIPIIPDIGYLAELSPTICALNRISGDRPRNEVSYLSVETVLTKLQLELITLVVCPLKSLMFRCMIAVLPHTATRAACLIRDIKASNNPAYFIKWVNDSVMHRDYMAILKTFNMADQSGAKAEVPTFDTPKSVQQCRIRPMTAD